VVGKSSQRHRIRTVYLDSGFEFTASALMLDRDQFVQGWISCRVHVWDCNGFDSSAYKLRWIRKPAELPRTRKKKRVHLNADLQIIHFTDLKFRKLGIVMSERVCMCMWERETERERDSNKYPGNKSHLFKRENDVCEEGGQPLKFHKRKFSLHLQSGTQIYSQEIWILIRPSTRTFKHPERSQLTGHQVNEDKER